MEVCQGIPGPSLDLIIHSPGGSPEATLSIVRYLRTKFADIRAFIPLAAMPAATMWALACDRIVMGKHSQLGPIDPQMVALFGQFPARAIINQLEEAQKECAADPSKIAAWLPTFQQCGPALIALCKDAEKLGRRLVKEWLAQYMFRSLPRQEAEEKAAAICDYFADYDARQSHGLGIDRNEARSAGVVIEDLETDEKLQDAVLSVHHATMHTLQGGAVKIIENHLGRGFYKVIARVQMQVPMQGGQFQLGLFPRLPSMPES